MGRSTGTKFKAWSFFMASQENEEGVQQARTRTEEKTVLKWVEEILFQRS
eukprot:CAMPEP_0178584090 /NCGR_PEP_ID=MMETSP0697-20121206/24627_1 /TAXON_ID=265572 /ORGANISM="Extubocellulus spinifer, Strain CCMP396" /LENGTH=49 /DNA_ID=CAMNT_0020219975 /DNA_START=30 /DNA_END=179 /DNA_ORIENTATION=-